MFVFRKIWRALFLEAPVLRLVLLLYYRQFLALKFRKKGTLHEKSSNTDFFRFRISLYLLRI